MARKTWFHLFPHREHHRYAGGFDQKRPVAGVNGMLGEKRTRFSLRFFLLLTVLVVVSAVSIGFVASVTGQPQCPPGFSFSPNSGTGCVQDDCYSIGFLDYTGHCTCPEGQTGCYEEVDYDTFDINVCTPFCPYSRLVACVSAGSACPNSQHGQEPGAPLSTEIDFDLLEKIYDDIIPLVEKLNPALITDLIEEFFPEESRDDTYLDTPVPADVILDDPEAGFSADLYCNEDPLPEDGINCRVIITEGEVANPYQVNWVLDGYKIKSTMMPSGSDPFFFPNPPPGSHTVVVQVTNQTDGRSRVSIASVNVQYVEGAKVSPWLQAAAGAGSVAVLSSWLWAQWLANKAETEAEQQRQDAADRALEKSRAEWYEEQMRLTDGERAEKQVFEAYQEACEKEWKRFRNELVKITDQYEKSDYLLDLYDDVHKHIFKDGKWDLKQLLRVQEMIQSDLIKNIEMESISQWKSKMESLNTRQARFEDLTGSWTAIGVRIIAGIATGGASEAVFIPSKAIANSIYAKQRAELLGLTGWDAAKSIMTESGAKLLIEYGVNKIVGGVIKRGAPYLLKAASWVGNKVLPDSVTKAIGDYWSKAMTKLTAPPQPDPKLPVIHQSWGRGPQVFVHQPIKPGVLPPVSLGMDQYLKNHIAPISPSLARDIGTLYREGISIDKNLSNLLSQGGRYTLTQANADAIKVLSNPAYQQAVNQGLIPASAQQFIYQTRDKVCKNAIVDAFKKLDNILLDGKPASSYIKSVTITGTGAKPLAPGAINRFTDFDSTVRAGDSAVERQAERLFSNTFHQGIQDANLRSSTAKVNMFPGFHPEPIAPHPEGYSSEAMLHWTKLDSIYRGQTAIRLENGSVMFNAHPDVSPMPGYGPMGPLAHYPADTSAAFADANRLIVNSVNNMVAKTGQPMSHFDIMREHGKQAQRVWLAANAGSGQPVPAFINQLQALKTDPNLMLTPAQTRQLWDQFSRFVHLPSDLGTIK